MPDPSDPILPMTLPPVAAPTAAPSVVDDVIEKIRRLMRSRRLARGARLPAERELADALGVSRPSLREALATLGYLGVLETRPGSGTRIAESCGPLLRAPFEFLLMLDPGEHGEVREVREVLEVRLAERAAERRTDADLETLEEILERFRDASDDPLATAGIDAEFHGALADAAVAPLLARMLDGLRAGALAGADAGAFAPGPWAIHADLLSAVRRHSAVDAAAAVRVHMALCALPPLTPTGDDPLAHLLTELP